MNSKTIEKRFDVIRTLLAIAISLGIALVIIIIVSDNPGNALYNFLIGPLTSPRRFANVIELSIPLMFCGLAVSIVFAAGQNNMAAEGSFYVACAWRFWWKRQEEFMRLSVFWPVRRRESAS